jgi:hypothetical protein
MLGLVLVVFLICSGNVSVCARPGVLRNPPSGHLVSNLDPNINSPFNNEIYDPNFIPGFQAGLTNYSVDWSSGRGYAKIGYSVGPWAHEEFSIPHLAVGPQCCNFVEVPYTQQFRLPSWGDYHYVRAGMGPPGVNVQNYTAVFGGPTSYAGLRTDRNWTAAVSLDWAPPTLMNPANEWAAIGIAVTQVVPGAKDELVYSLINFWMDHNSSGPLGRSDGGMEKAVTGTNLVSYHPFQIQSRGNQTISVDLTPFLSDTLRTLNIATSVQRPPLIAYVYLNVEGYNFSWNSTMWSFYLLTPSPLGSSPGLTMGAFVALAAGIGVVVAGILLLNSKRWSRREGAQEPM